MISYNSMTLINCCRDLQELKCTWIYEAHAAMENTGEIIEGNNTQKKQR
jgi:hypothetical protein